MAPAIDINCQPLRRQYMQFHLDIMSFTLLCTLLAIHINDGVATRAKSVQVHFDLHWIHLEKMRYVVGQSIGLVTVRLRSLWDTYMWRFNPMPPACPWCSAARCLAGIA